MEVARWLVRVTTRSKAEGQAQGQLHAEVFQKMVGLLPELYPPSSSSSTPIPTKVLEYAGELLTRIKLAARSSSPSSSSSTFSSSSSSSWSQTQTDPYATSLFHLQGYLSNHVTTHRLSRARYVNPAEYNRPDLSSEVRGAVDALDGRMVGVVRAVHLALRKGMSGGGRGGGQVGKGKGKGAGGGSGGGTREGAEIRVFGEVARGYVQGRAWREMEEVWEESKVEGLVGEGVVGAVSFLGFSCSNISLSHSTRTHHRPPRPDILIIYMIWAHNPTGVLGRWIEVTRPLPPSSFCFFATSI